MAIYRPGQRAEEKLRKSSISGVCVQSAGVNPVPIHVQEPTGEVDKPLSVRVGPAIIEVTPGYDTELLRDVVRTLSGLC